MILLYHKVADQQKSKYYITTANFRRHLEIIKSQGKIVVPLSSYDSNNPRHVVITFDGGYECMLTTAIPLLREFHYPYEIFIIGNYVGKDNAFDFSEPLENFLNEEQLKTLVADGYCHLQWHTNSHPLLKDITTLEQWIGELTIPENLRRLDPDGFNYFAYPHGQFAPWQSAEIESRFKGALLTFQNTRNNPFNIARTCILGKTDFWWLMATPFQRKIRKLEIAVKEGRIFSTLFRHLMGIFNRK